MTRYVKTENIYAFLIIITGFLLRISLSTKMEVINVDATGVLEKSMTLPHYLKTLPGWWPPLYPILTLSISNFIEIETAGKVVSIVSGIVLTYVIYELVKRLYDKQSAIIAASIICFHPILLYYSLFTTTEILYLACIYISVLFTINWIKTKTITNIIFAGIGAACAYLTRAEGFLLILQIGFIILLVLFYEISKKRVSLKYSIIFLLVYTLVCTSLIMPYLIFLKGKMGLWSISRISGSDLVLFNVDEEPLVFGLTEDKRHVKGYLHESYNKYSLTKELIKSPKIIVSKWIGNIKYLFREILPILFINKVFLVIFLGLSILNMVLRREDLAINFLIIFLLLPVVITSFYLIQIRTEMYIIPVIIILSSGALGFIVGEVIDKIGHKKWHRIYHFLVLSLVIPMFFIYYHKIEPVVEEKGKYGVEFKKAGLWIKEKKLHKGPIIERKGWVSYYSQNLHLKLPYASYEDIIYYARVNKAKYIVMDDLITLKLRPKLKFLMNNSPAGLKLIYESKNSEGKKLRIFEFEDYPQH